MTSLQLFPEKDHNIRGAPPEWGTGQPDEHTDLWVPRAATWIYTGEPRDQYYRLTQLKLSNLRKDDQLVPRPQDTVMGKLLINKSFPAEHPYHSHMSQLAVFPKFDSSEDPKRGVKAKQERPINSEMPANPYDITIVKKTKGSGLRHEMQALPQQSEKAPLHWLGENFFDQQVKSHGGRQEFYPVPPRAINPNLVERHGNMALSDRSANTLRNVERSHWTTTHELDYTGLGPSNPQKLDNLEDKRFNFLLTGKEDDKLKPRGINTFDPPRPVEGRVARMLTPRPRNQPMLESGTPSNPNYSRKMTLSEREENRLWNGQEYINLPENAPGDLRWREIELGCHPNPQIEAIGRAQMSHSVEEAPYPPTGPPPDDEESYLKKLAEEREQTIQEMEAQNRWKVLESGTPSHDITALNVKYQHVDDTDRPSTFYGHEGRYNEERAGLYKTSYDPKRLSHSMADLGSAAPELMYAIDSGLKVSSTATSLREEVPDSLRQSKTLGTVQARLSGDKPSAVDQIVPFMDGKGHQKEVLRPSTEGARTRIQEGGVTLRESTMGDSYNVHKFLQENIIPKHARNEPLFVMSHQNQKLSNVVRASSQRRTPKSVQFSDNVTVATVNTDMPVRMFSAGDSNGVGNFEEQQRRAAAGVAGGGDVVVNTTQYLSTQAQYNKENEGSLIFNQKPSVFTQTPRPLEPVVESRQMMEVQPRRHARRPATTDTEYRDEFVSHSTNFLPTNLKYVPSFRTSYENQFPYHDIGYKNDEVFKWEPGCGWPRPQTALLDIQNSFKKTEVRKKFHAMFNEGAPDLRRNIHQGKKHSFNGINAQLIHG
ncbi:uncharacterized protein LOC121385529 [Gigantopelta aegis]|uniref:uncharacterized protein LOC121385529 n=1 Tax=Gigantopelta aegis TaxID=1735272 RepID=UPI001B88CBAE|nr:uncharacterized protein LOC121385529 [Gigantopelta aegis]